MKTRIVKKGSSFYPEYWRKPLRLFGTQISNGCWRPYKEEDEPCHLTGHGGGSITVSRGSKEAAIKFIEGRKLKPSTVVWQSDKQ